MTNAMILISTMLIFHFLDGDVSRTTFYGVYISQLIRFARVSCHLADFNARNKTLTAKLLKQGYRYHKFQNTLNWFLNIIPDCAHLCNKACQNLNFMVT